MLQIEVQLTHGVWDEKNEVFIEPEYQVLQLEHSLVSLSKWESKWCKTFIGKRDLTDEETIDYIKCMTITPNVNPETYKHLSRKNIKQIEDYIESPMTATHLREDPNARPNKEPMTSELIYWWMITFGIPFECQTWHLNRLLTLIRVCDRKNQPARKVSKSATAREYAALNAARRRQLNTRG